MQIKNLINNKMKRIIILLAITLLCNIVDKGGKNIIAQTFQIDTVVQTLQDLPINGGVDVYFIPFFSRGEYYQTDTTVNYGIESIASNACFQFIPFFKFGNDTSLTYKFYASYNSSSLGKDIPVFDKNGDPFRDITIALSSEEFGSFSYNKGDSIAKATIESYIGGNLTKSGQMDSVIEYSYKFEKNGTQVTLKSNATGDYFGHIKKTYSESAYKNLTLTNMVIDNLGILQNEFGNIIIK